MDQSTQNLPPLFSWHTSSPARHTGHLQMSLCYVMKVMSNGFAQLKNILHRRKMHALWRKWHTCFKMCTGCGFRSNCNCFPPYKIICVYLKAGLAAGVNSVCYTGWGWGQQVRYRWLSKIYFISSLEKKPVFSSVQKETKLTSLIATT